MVPVLVIYRLHTGSDRHLGHRLRVELLGQQQHDRRPEQREQRNQPDLVWEVHWLSYHFSKSISSASTVSLLRNRAIRMPSPTAASATASTITKIAKICPWTAWAWCENATRLMFTAFRISSMDIRIITMLRRVSTPTVPMSSSAALKAR